MSFFEKIFSPHLPPRHPRRRPAYPGPLTGAALEGLFADCDDLEKRALVLGGGPVTATLYYIDGITAAADISRLVVQPLTDSARLPAPATAKACIARIEAGAVYGCTLRRRDTLDAAAEDLLRGYAVLVFDREELALTFEMKANPQRSVSEPTTEKSVKGAKDAFIENLRMNTALVRRRIASPALKICQTTVGRKSRTAVALVYVDGVADGEFLAELRRRVDAIDVDGLLTTAYLEEYIVDRPRSPFPQLIQTERPDKFALNLLEGRVGLLADGLPLGFLVPATLPELLKVPEDSSRSFLTASLLTCLRFIGLLVTVFLPGFYVAVALYHQEMIPVKLLLSMIDSKQQVPFSTFVEISAMLIAFEFLQEAGLRLPSQIGQTVSILGGLIVGQAAVEAKVVSPITVIVVALAGIAGYTCPNSDLENTARVLRFALVLAAMAGGMFGIMCAAALLVWHLCALESMGVAYLSPLTDGGIAALLRGLARLPLRLTKRRDEALRTPDKRAQK